MINRLIEQSETSKKPKKKKIRRTKKQSNNKLSKLDILRLEIIEERTPFLFSFQKLIKDTDNIERTFDPTIARLFLSPVSGYEPKYEPRKWNKNKNIKVTHNCYSYAMNQIVSNRKGKPQPGYFSHFTNISNNDYKDCKSFYKRLKKDSPSIYLTTFDKKCRKGFSKAFIVLANKTYHTDYHFYRQDSNGYWSHKPGSTEVTNLDASNKIIRNPEIANRNYKRLNYNKPCFYFCKSDKLSKTSSVSV